MANNKEVVETITSIDEDFAQRYTGAVKKAKLCDYASVKGCMMIKPADYTIWENVQKEMDRRFKETGTQSVYMPIFISESLLEEGKNHVEGFAPEVAWVTHGGLGELQEHMCARSASETLFCDLCAKDIHPYRNLPRVHNQWCSAVRWEKTIRPFLRSREFLWQEGHTAHASAEEAEAKTTQIPDLYMDFCEEVLVTLVIKGQEADKKKLAGAGATCTIGSLMHDGRTLQSGVSHDFGGGFARAFDIQFTNRDNTSKYVHQTSWSVNTRIIGAIIMVHGDDNGLVLPPRTTPIQVMVVSVQQQREDMLDKAYELREYLTKAELVIEVDDTDESPGWKFTDCEMRSVPLRVEIGSKDMEKDQAVLVRRGDHEKSFVPLDELESRIGEVLGTTHDAILEKVRKHRDAHTYTATGWDEFVNTVSNKPGFIRTMRCDCLECEEKTKEVAGATSGCIPFEQKSLSDKYVCCRKPAKKVVYWGKTH